MKRKYFGILPSELYKNNKLKDVISYLSDNGICQKIIVKSGRGELRKTDNLGESLSKSHIDEVYESALFITDLVNEFYNFLLIHYKSGLGDYIITNQELYEKTFGMNKNESKKIALNYFNYTYSKNSIHPTFKYKFDKNKNVIPATKFESLKKYKDNLIQNLKKNKNLIIPYLAEDIGYYNRTLFENDNTIKEIFEFENSLKILVDLNKKFQFEKDDIFTPQPKSKKIFEEYTNQFGSLKQVEFIENQINSKKKVQRSFIVSLFDFFSNKLKMNMPSGKEFGIIINEYFDFNFSEIKLNGSEGDKHSKKIKSLQKEWSNYTN